MISARLVGAIVHEVEKQPEKLQAKRQKIEQKELKCSAIEDAATMMLGKNKPIVSSGQIQKIVKDQEGLEVDRKLVCRVMRKDMGLGYRLAKTVPVQSNSERCLVL